METKLVREGEMPIRLEDMRFYASTGLNLVCATCPKFHEAVDRGLNTCGVEGCGGPKRGMTFPKYTGSILDWTQWCFVCGDVSCVTVGFGEGRRLGVCSRHLKNLSSDSVVKSRDGALMQVQSVPVKPEPETLGALLAKLERGEFL